MPFPDLIASTGSVNSALYGRSRRGFPCSSTSHSMTPLSELALFCEGGRFTLRPTLTVDWAVVTPKRGMATFSFLYRPDFEIPLNVHRVAHGADGGSEDQPLRNRSQARATRRSTRPTDQA